MTNAALGGGGAVSQISGVPARTTSRNGWGAALIRLRFASRHRAVHRRGRGGVPRFGQLIVDANHVRLRPAPDGSPTCALEARPGWVAEILEPHGRVRKRLARATAEGREIDDVAAEGDRQ